MASREGNVILAPGFTRGPEVKSKELMYSMEGLLQKGVTLKPNDGVYEVGTLLAYDNATKKYRRATTAAETVGFLRIASDTSDPAKLGNVVLGGVVKAATVAAANPGALTADATALTALATALNGTYNAQFGYIKF
jgi:hypothetical protein